MISGFLKLEIGDHEDVAAYPGRIDQLDFTTKGQDEPVRAQGRQILRARPRESKVRCLRDLSGRLPNPEQETVRRAIRELTQ